MSKPIIRTICRWCGGRRHGIQGVSSSRSWSCPACDPKGWTTFTVAADPCAGCGRDMNAELHTAECPLAIAQDHDDGDHSGCIAGDCIRE